MTSRPLDPAQERRRLRVALESMKQKRQLATGGFVAGLGCLYVAHWVDGLPNTLRLIMAALAPTIALLTALPFLRSPCPSCRQRYHSFNSLLRRPDNTPPCRACGFQIDRHISMY